MRKLLTFAAILLFSTSAISNSDEWVYESSHATSFHSDNRPALINILFKGGSGKAPEIEITISLETARYTYKSKWWEVIGKDWAEKSSLFMLEDKNFIQCSDLSKIGEGWADVYLKISEEEYKNLMSSNCKGFIHRLSRDTWRTVVFPVGSNEAVVVNHYGV